MNLRKYLEIENSTLTKKQKSILFKIEKLQDNVNFWQTKINVAKYHIEQNEKKISDLKDSLKF